MSAPFKLHIVSGLLLAAIISPTSLLAQEVRQPHTHGQQILSEINKDYRQGNISFDQKVLYQFYAGLKPEALPEEYRSADGKPIKCGTPLFLEYRQNREKLSSGTVAEIESLIEQQRPQVRQQETYTSPSGKFIIHYETSGGNAVPAGDDDPEYGGNGIPDYVDWTAAAADSSWRHQIRNLGFTDPVTGSSDPYPIHIFSLGAYGETSEQNGTTRIYINSRLDTSPYQDNDDVNKTHGAIKVTVAHELKHAVQFANSEWYSLEGNASPHSLNWSEMDATLMEEIVYDNVNDYYNYITDPGESIFLTSDHGIPGAYWGVTWSLFMVEKYGIEFWVETWEKIGEVYETEKDKGSDAQYAEMIPTIDEVLRTGYSDLFQNALSVSHMWHFAAGPTYSAPDYGFEERAAYPDPNINVEYRPAITGDFLDPENLAGSSARYYLFEPAFVDLGNIAVSIDSDSPDLSIGMLFYLKSGGVYARSVSASEPGVTTHNSIWKWDEVDKVGIIVSNSGENSSIYRLRTYSEQPETFELVQNFPNPFNPTTRIRFTIPEESHVTLSVYDVAGRKVQTLIDERLESSFHEVTFDAGGLASGVYIYRLVTDETVITKKMTLIK